VFKLLRWVDSRHLISQDGTTALAKNINQCLKSSSFQKHLFGDMDAAARFGFLQIAVTVTGALTNVGGSEGALLRQEICSALFVILCVQLPRSLRKERKAVQGHKPPTEKILEPSLLIDWILPMVGGFPNDLDVDTLKAMDPTCVSTAVRGCLKYGMAEAESPIFLATSTKCLELARRLVAVNVAPTSALHENTPSPSDVYSMVVSHSKFKECLTRNPGSQERAARKLELVRLLLACVSRSESPVEFQKEVWDVICSSYNAGVGIIDTSIRRLIFVAVSRQTSVSSPKYKIDEA
jgi:hypothetical protein